MPRLLALFTLLLGFPVSAAELRLNQVQLVGSHNSYKLAMSAENFTLLSAARPEVAASLEYDHRSLPEQLKLGIRKLELDVFYDPQGALFGAAFERGDPDSERNFGLGLRQELTTFTEPTDGYWNQEWGALATGRLHRFSEHWNFIDRK